MATQAQSNSPESTAASGDAGADVLKVIVALLFPPLGAFLAVGFAAPFWINLLLTLFFYVPGAVHAAWLIGRSK